jgi:hypothetical protein
MLVCRVLVGQTCLGNRSMKICPTGYNSTTNGSDIYVVYSNQQILPVYRITYKQNLNTYEDNPVPYTTLPSIFGFCNIL